jgi:hypothetical protein
MAAGGQISNARFRIDPGLIPTLRERASRLPTIGSSGEVGIVSAPGLSPASVRRGSAQVGGAIDGTCFSAIRGTNYAILTVGRNEIRLTLFQ